MRLMKHGKIPPPDDYWLGVFTTKTTTMLSVFFTLVACGHAPRGYIDNVALPDSAFASCAKLRRYVEDATRTRALKDLGLTITEQDIADARASISAPTEDMLAQVRERIQVIVQVFAGSYRNKVDVWPLAARRKIDATLDWQLGLNDEKFRAYAEQYRNAMSGPQKQHFVPREVDDYLKQKRAEWWQAERAKVDVNLRDPTLKAKCSL